MSEALRRHGIRSSCASSPTHCERCIVIVVKHLNADEAQAARHAGSVVLFDVIDPHQQTVLSGGRRRALDDLTDLPVDGLIVANRAVAAAVSRRFPFALARIIRHHWDPRCRVATWDDAFSLVYFGRSGVVWPIPGLVRRDVGPANHVLVQEDFDALGRFTCHYDVRDPRAEAEYRGKHAVKVATAAACDANIIASPYPSAVEMLGEDYPFLLPGDDVETVRAMHAFARDVYGTALWAQALERMREVRAATHIDRIADDYLEFCRSFGLLRLPSRSGFLGTMFSAAVCRRGRGAPIR